jgi:hypothetical protein
MPSLKRRRNVARCRIYSEIRASKESLRALGVALDYPNRCCTIHLAKERIHHRDTESTGVNVILIFQHEVTAAQRGIDSCFSESTVLKSRGEGHTPVVAL